MTRLLTIVLSAIVVQTAGAQAPAASQAADAERVPPPLVSLRLAVEDLTRTFGRQYPNGAAYLDRIRALEMKCATGGLSAADKAALAELSQAALLANPLLDLDALLVIRRSEANLGLPYNWESNSSLPLSGFDNELMRLSPMGPEGELVTVFRPDGGRFLGDVDLDFDAKRILFSMPGANGRWQVFEMALDGNVPVELPLICEPDVDNYDACYLPDGNIVFTSTAPFVGVPCVTGSSHVSNLFAYDRASGAIRRLTFEQDHDWCPTVLNNGRILYLRWEYSDLPHFVSRILFHMNPDGTGQMEYYGSNSYWPNSLFYARPVPDHPTRFVAVVGGHHDNPRMGELALFDPAIGRHEADGAIQRIPGRGKRVEPILLDGLTKESWPKFLHPYPLSSSYFLVSSKPTPESQWAIYLVDVFDNMTLVKKAEPGYALLEPVPMRETRRPPVVAPRIDLARDDAVVYLFNVYEGKGLEGVPRGTIKKLRLFTYHFAYHGMGGQLNRVGLDGPWDIKRVLGTVPVDEDGSALFRVPANTPIAVQPLDAEGRAVQLMRSWFTAMPGEFVSCVGCHERQTMTPPSASVAASTQAPAEIEPWYGPVRGFSFVREVQPVLDAYCVRCHDGQMDGAPDLRVQPPVHTTAKNEDYNKGTHFLPSYLALRVHLRTPTIESDMHLLPPYEFHASTTELVQMLDAGHHGVRLDQESWNRLVTWIDLNAPAHGTWHDIIGEERVFPQRDRRREMMRRYAAIDEDPEAVFPPAVIRAPDPDPQALAAGGPERPALSAIELRENETGGKERTVLLPDGSILPLVRIPQGSLAYGDTRIEIEPFWMGTFEITNAQFARFDPAHDSRLEHGDFLQFSEAERGWTLNEPNQPVVRVSWEQASAFCEWLSHQTGQPFALPTEQQWEYACRAGAMSPMAYGEMDADFTPYANLADFSLRFMETLSPWDMPSGAVPEWRPARADLNDGHRVSSPVGSYQPNAWGLYDMHGNAAEWTSSRFSYTGREESLQAVCGGSWYDRPHRAQASFRLGYRPWQRVFNVGFRVVCNQP